MKKTRTALLALVLMASLSFGSCGDPGTPEGAVDRLFDAFMAFDPDAVNEALSPAAQGNLAGCEEFTEDLENPMASTLIDYLKRNAEGITYEILETTTDGDTATVSVKCKYVDGSARLGGMRPEDFAQLMELMFTGENLTGEEEALIALETLCSGDGLGGETYAEKTIKIDCVKAYGAWVVKEMNEDLADVFTSNLLDTAEAFENYEAN